MHKKKNYYISATLLVITILFGGFKCFLLQEEPPNEVNAAVNVEQFADVAESDWFYENINFVVKNGLMNGISERSFSPNEITKRGMIVTILWRLEGKPIETQTRFLDLTKDAYYFDAVNWACAHNIVSGYNETLFGPEDEISREQLATIMYRYANYKKYDISEKESLTDYTDFEQISDYALEAFGWATANKIITGVSDNSLNPQGNALRCQVAAIFHRFCQKYKTEIANITSPEKQIEVEAGNKIVSNINNSASGSLETNMNQNIQTKESPIITAGETTAKSGDTVDVFVELKNNPGILGMTLSLEYDESAMTLLSVENGDAVSNVLTLTTSKTLSSGVKFVWDGVDINPDDIKDGVILKFKFALTDDILKGSKYPLTLQYNDGDIVDFNLREISPQINQGYIKIE